MAGFEDAYAELFGERPTYDPIDTSPSRLPQPRVAISAGLSMSGPGGLADDSPFQQAYNELNASMPAEQAQPSGETEWTDYAKSFGAGGVDLAGAVVGIPEYFARQGAGRGQTPYQQFFTETAETLAGPRRALGGVANNIRQSMTPEALDRAAREITTLDPMRTIWQGDPKEFVSSLMLKASNAAPSTLATLLPGALMLRAGLRNGAITYLGASEGALSVGSIANNIAEEIENASEDELMQGSSLYRQLREELDPAQAREILINESQGKAPLIGGFVVGLISAKAGRYLEPKLTDVGGGVASRFGRGFVSEGMQEAGQSGVEQATQNIAAQTFDSNRNFDEGLLEQTVQGGLIGGMLGGTVNAAIGPRDRALPGAPPSPQGVPPTEPEPELPASFQEIFGEGGQQPQGPESFDDVFQNPNRAESNMSTLDQLQARDRYVQNPQASLQRTSALSNAIVRGHVDPDVAAALNIRRDQMMPDMFAEQPNPMEGPAGTDMSQVWARNEQMDLQGGGMNEPPGTSLIPTQGPVQQPLLQERLRGVGRVPLEPMAAQPASDDMSPPAGFEGAPAADMGGAAPGRSRADFLRQRAALMPQVAPTFKDTEQQDLFDQSQPPSPDEPSAEPVSDLMAQLEDLRDPDSPRKGVYMSAANLANLRANGALEQVRGIGVPLANFDGKGGILVAKNRAVAEELINLLGQGAGSMQEVLGYATGAGGGKPEGGNIAVQLRDENGNVIRESLVADEAEADQLAEDWELETGNEAVITSAPQAIRRREQLVRAENRQLEQVGEAKRVNRMARGAIREELGEGETAERAEKTIRRAESEEGAARRLVRLAANERKKERRTRWGDIDAPESLDFKNPKQAEQYKELFMAHAGQQVLQNTAKTASEKLKARAKQNEIADQLRALRDIAEPTTRSEQIARTASKVSTEEVTKIRRQAAETAKRNVEPEDHAANVESFSDEEVDVMDEPKLNQAFTAAARFISGRRRSPSTYTEVLANHPTPSEKRKLVKRVQAFIRARTHGPASKGFNRANLTRTAEKKEGSDRPVRKSVFDTRNLTVEGTVREQSKTDRAKMETRAKQAFKDLGVSIKLADSIITKTQKGDFEILEAQREPNGKRTEASSKMLVARAYLRVLAEYGDTLQKANNRSTPGAIEQVEIYNKLIREIQDLSPRQFAERLSKLFYAEERESVKGAAKADPVVLGDLVFPNQREKSLAESKERLDKRLRQAGRIERRLANKNSAYDNYVSPLMQKFIDSVAKRGYMDYEPSLQELRAVQFAMRLWRSRKQSRDDFYLPVRKFFTELGIDIDSMKLDKNFKWETPDKLLQRRSRFGNRDAETDTDATGVEILHGRGLTREGPKQTIVAQRSSEIAEAREALARDVPYTAREVERLARMKTYHEANLSLHNQLNRAQSVLDIQRAEEEFVRTLQDQGLWEWSEKGRKIGLGRLTIPGFTRDTSSTVRTISSRLRQAEMTKAQAIDAIKERYPLFKPTQFSAAAQEETQSIDEAERRVHKVLDPARAQERELQELMRREALTPEQRRVLDALRRRDNDTSNLNLMVSEHVEEREPIYNAAKAVASMLESNESLAFPSLTQVLDRATAHLPEGHRFRTVMERLMKVPNIGQVQVTYSEDPAVMQGSIARYIVEGDGFGTHPVRVIAIDRSQLEDLRSKGHDPHLLLLHAITHEGVHAATRGAIENNPHVRTGLTALMNQTRRLMEKRGIDTSGFYAFRDRDPNEFISEAFSHGVFQQQLKQTMIEPRLSIWDMIMKFVKRVLGIEDTTRHDNALDAVMSLTDALFTGELKVSTKGADDAAALDIKDNQIRDAVSNVLDRYGKSNDSWKALWRRAKDSATGWLLPATSMEQMRDVYSQYFQDGSKNPMADYMRAFFKRNADNSANMEDATKLSRKWTELAEEDPEGALEMSRIMTEATMHQVHPQVPLSDSSNEHVKHDSQKRVHADLARRWNAMPEPMQDLYDDVVEYYDKTLRREVALMTLNALRGYLTKGTDAPLTDDDFDYKESDVEALRLNTKEGLEEEFGALLSPTALDSIYRIAALPAQRKGPYFPLMRFGDYVVYAEREVEKKPFTDRKDANTFRDDKLAADPTLDVSVRRADNGQWVATVTEKEFRTAETRSEAEQHRMEMSAQYGEANTTPVQLKADIFKSEATIKSNAGLKTILGKLDDNPAAQAAIKHFYLQSLADKSFRKHELSRKNRRGVDYETQHRTFASYSKQAAYYTSQLRYGWQMADALRDMQKVAVAHRDEAEISGVRMGEVVREINQRDKMTHDFQEVSKIVRGGVELSHFVLLTSPSYWMINATQPYMVTLPWLAARSNIGDATTALLNAQKLIASPLASEAVSSWGGLKALKSKAAAEKAFSVLEQVEKRIGERGGDRAGEYLKMLKVLKQHNIIDMSMQSELRDMASGKQSITQNVVDASRIMSHLTEVNNRIMTAVASYDIGRAKGMTPEQATEFAMQATSITQFNYSSGNKPRLFQATGPLKSLGPLVFQFMQYPQHMYALLIQSMRGAFGDSAQGRSIARKTLAGVLATHFAAGGLIGMMLQPIKWAAGLAAFMFGDDDEPYDFDRSVKEMTNELFGDTIGQVVSSGVPRLAGIDVSQRMSLGTLYMVDLRTDNADSFLGSALQSFGGPLTGLLAGAFNGSRMALDGEYQKAMESVAPKFLKDLSKAWRFSNEGMTDATGKTFMKADEMSAQQTFLQYLGLNPASVSDAYARREAINDAKRHDKGRRETLLKRFRRAETPADRAQISLEIAEFNKHNPEAVITRSQLIRSLTGSLESEGRMQALGADLRGREVLYRDRDDYMETDDEDEE